MMMIDSYCISFLRKKKQGDDGLLPIDGQNGFPGQSGAVGPRGIPGVPGCNGSKVKTNERCNRAYVHVDVFTEYSTIWRAFSLLSFPLF